MRCVETSTSRGEHIHHKQHASDGIANRWAVIHRTLDGIPDMLDSLLVKIPIGQPMNISRSRLAEVLQVTDMLSPFLERR